MLPVRRLPYFLVLLSLAPTMACFNGEDKAGYESARLAYEGMVTAEAKKLAEIEAPAILEALAAVGTEAGEENDVRALLAVTSKFRAQGTAAGETLCTAFELQAREAGSGKTGEERLDQARQDTRRILRDT